MFVSANHSYRMFVSANNSDNIVNIVSEQGGSLLYLDYQY